MPHSRGETTAQGILPFELIDVPCHSTAAAPSDIVSMSLATVASDVAPGSGTSSQGRFVAETTSAEATPEVAASSGRLGPLVSPTSRILDGSWTGIGQDAAPLNETLSVIAWHHLLPLLRGLRDAVEPGSAAE
jgi:hypothetical protein